MSKLTTEDLRIYLEKKVSEYPYPCEDLFDEGMVAGFKKVLSLLQDKEEQQKEVVSAEDILTKHTGLSINDEDAYIIHTKTEYVLKAMEGYANQFKQK